VSRLAQAKKDVEENVVVDSAKASATAAADTISITDNTTPIETSGMPVSSSATLSLDSNALEAKHLSGGAEGAVAFSQSSILAADHKGYTEDMLSVASSSQRRVEEKEELDLGNDESCSSSNDAKVVNTKLVSPDRGPTSIAIARPHHLPKMESLSSKLDEIRRNMELQGADSEAPWDASGKPLMKKKKSSRKEKKSAGVSEASSRGEEEIGIAENSAAEMK
jgi:hypothetical protein